MKKTYLLEGLCCANCAAKIEHEASKLDGVNDASLNFMTTKMQLDFQDEYSDSVTKQLKKIVRRIEPEVELREV